MAEMKTQEIIRFGIVGCANIAIKVSRAISLAPNAVIVAVGSRSLTKAQSFISGNGLDPNAVKAYGSYDEVLEDSTVDAVYMPLPTSLHVKWATKAAEKGKHLLLEKPCALNVAELDLILGKCEQSRVQFMDGTMWMHHPRTEKMKQLLLDPDQFGQLRMVNSLFTFPVSSDFLENDIRVKPDLDALGALGDIGWYCIRSVLLASNFQLPKQAVALRNPVLNTAGVILSCGASLVWDDGKVATFHCSFLSHLTMQLTAIGTKGTLTVNDFVIPFEEKCAEFIFLSEGGFNELVSGWRKVPSNHVVNTELPQEARMVAEFSRLVGGVKSNGMAPEVKWPQVTRKTQLVLDAVKASIHNGFVPVDIV